MFWQEITAERRRYQLLNNVAGDVRKKTKPRNPGSNKSKVGKKSSTTGKSRTTKGKISPKTSVKDEPKGNSLSMIVATVQTINHGKPFQPLSVSIDHLNNLNILWLTIILIPGIFVCSVTILAYFKLQVNNLLLCSRFKTLFLEAPHYKCLYDIPPF